MQMAEKTMDVFEPWKKAKIGFDVESTGLDGALFCDRDGLPFDKVPKSLLPAALIPVARESEFPIPLLIAESILIYYIQYNILFASTLDEI